MKRKEVTEAQQLNENPLAIALMGALVGMGLEKEKAKKAAAQAVNDAQTGAWKDPDKQPAAARPAPQGADYNQIMKRGSRGEGVKELQRNLGMTGSEIDGIFGPATEKAVKTFQKNSGAKVDGIVGPETRGMIEKYANSPDKDPSKVNVQRPAGVANQAQTAKKYKKVAPPAGFTPPSKYKNPMYVQSQETGSIYLIYDEQNGNYGGVGPIMKFKGPSGRDELGLGQSGRVIAVKDVDLGESVMTDKKQIDEASININGADASEVAEILRMMQLAGAEGAKVVEPGDITPKPMPMPMPSPGGCGGPKEPGMADMIKLMGPEEAMEEEDDYDGGFDDASTEPDEAYANDVSAVIPAGNDLHKEKGSYPATAGGDNPMNVEDEDLEETIKSQLRAALAARK